jgi:nucleotide-binding universal stress UspA family protein
MLPIHNILYPADFSDYSAYAFQLACSLARDYGARLLVLHVAASPVIGFGEGVIPPEPVVYKNELRRQLQQLQAGDPKIALEHRLVEGDAVTEILRVAGESQCDLIVMGTHGRTGLGRLLMGSVAEQVVRKASCPVLTVKAMFPVSQPASAPAIEMAEKAIAPTKA